MRTCAGLVCFVITLLCSAAVHVQTQEDGRDLTSGFPTLSQIQGNGSLLSERVFVTHDGERRHYPDSVGFTCDGVVTKLTFIALPGTGIGEVTFEIHISTRLRRSSRMTRSSRHSRMTPRTLRSSTNTNTATKFSKYGYEFTTSMIFLSGDTLHIDHQYPSDSPHRLLYQMGNEYRTACWRWRKDKDDSCGMDTDFPLLAVETDPPGCAYGFVDEALLRSEWANKTDALLYYTPERQLNFLCYGPGLVKKWTVGVCISGGENVGADIEIVTPDNTILHTCQLTPLQATQHLNMYECAVVPPVEVNGGEIIVINMRNTSNQVCYRHNGVRETALISVDLIGLCAPISSLSDVIEQATFIPNFAEIENDTLLFPNMTLTREGHLMTWIFAASDLGEDSGRNLYPQLQVYAFDALSGDYSLQFTLSADEARQTSYANVYEVAVEPPQPVQAGFVVGLVQPPKASGRLMLSFVRNAGPRPVSIPTGTRERRDVEAFPGREGALPLLTLEISPTSTALSTTTVSTDSVVITSKLLVSATTSPPVSATTSTSSATSSPVLLPSASPIGIDSDVPHLFIILGASIGGVLVVAAVSVVVVLVCISRNTSKATTTKDRAGFDQDLMQNRAYGTPSDINNGAYGLTPTHIVHQQAPSTKCNTTDIHFAPSDNNGAYGIIGEHTYDSIPDSLSLPRAVTMLKVPPHTASAEAASCHALTMSSINQPQRPKRVYVF